MREHLFRNWPLKITALVLACILWVVVAAEETTSELVPVRLDVSVPPQLSLARPVPQIRALVTGPGRELIKLYSTPLTVRLAVPPDVALPRHRMVIVPAAVELPRDARIVIQDIEPREIDLDLDRFVRRAVPVAIRGSVDPESGFALSGPVQITPRMVEVSGARSLVFGLDSVRTEALEVRGVTEAFQRTVPLDTALPLLQVTPSRITVTGRVRRL